MPETNTLTQPSPAFSKVQERAKNSHAVWERVGVRATMSRF
jgi:hypothetical protein